jgi:hypothetical protein
MPAPHPPVLISGAISLLIHSSAMKHTPFIPDVPCLTAWQQLVQDPITETKTVLSDATADRKQINHP